MENWRTEAVVVLRLVVIQKKEYTKIRQDKEQDKEVKDSGGGTVKIRGQKGAINKGYIYPVIGLLLSMFYVSLGDPHLGTPSTFLRVLFKTLSVIYQALNTAPSTHCTFSHSSSIGLGPIQMSLKIDQTKTGTKIKTYKKSRNILKGK